MNNNKRILLIQPRTGTWDTMSIRFPESLLAVAAVPSVKGYKIDLLDQRLEKNWKTKLTGFLAKNPILVGLTSMTGEQIGHMIDIINFIKTVSPVPIVFGGIHAILLPKQSCAHPYIDIVCEGEGDFTLYEIAESLREKKSLHNVKGIYFKEDGEIIYTGKRDIINDIDILPMPPYEILSVDRYRTFEIGQGGSATVFTSIGCPFKCKFCAAPVLRPKWRSFSVERVMDNIQFLQKEYNISNIYFQDDNIAGSLSRFRKLICQMANMDKKVKWGAMGIRADAICRLAKEDFDILLESGCHNLDIGVESGSRRINNFVNKGESLEHIIEANNKLASYPIKVKYTFMIGFPTETEKEVRESIDFATSLCKTNLNAYVLFFIFVPVKGTEFYNLAIEYGFKEPKSLEEWKHLQYEKWHEKYPSWLNDKEIKRCRAVSFVSYFANDNVKYKFTSLPLKIIFTLYNPIAKIRFRKQFFLFFVESYVQESIFKIKSFIEKKLYR